MKPINRNGAGIQLLALAFLFVVWFFTRWDEIWGLIIILAVFFGYVYLNEISKAIRELKDEEDAKDD